ncbi:MAG TPA: hypothetical protein VFN67_17975, partial [Polyangiales bacterium]|nr:hypothetical protein [Polyangiales bacterium]
MLRAAFQRGLDVLDRVPLGSRYRPGQQSIGLLQRWYAAQPKQRIIVAIVELNRVVEAPALESAVRALCVYHPYALGVCLARDLEQLSTRPLTPADPVPLMAAADREAWSLAEELVHVPFQPGAPLFRIARADNGKRLVCAFDHIMFDGISASSFACALARSIAGTPPSAARDDQPPSAARDHQPPSAARDDQPPSAARDDQPPSAARDDQQPSAARDDQ